MHRILIIGEVAVTAKKLWKRIADIEPELSLVDIKDNVENTVQWLQQNNTPDLIIYEVQVPHSPAFDIFNQTPISAPVVFITPHDPYIIGLFKEHGIHFIEKPVKKTDLQTIFSKLKEGNLPAQKIQIGNALQLYRRPQPVYKKRFVVRKGEDISTVGSETIAYFYTEEKNNHLVTFDGVAFDIDYNLDLLETMIDPTLFFRINRQFIVSVKSVAEALPYSKSRVKLHLKPFCEQDTIVSAARVAGFKNWMK